MNKGMRHVEFTPVSKALGISHDELYELIEPFTERCTIRDDPEWREQLRRRKRRILWKYLRWRLFGWLPRLQRLRETVETEYGDVWERADFANYDMTVRPDKFPQWEVGDRCLFAGNIGGNRIRQLVLTRILEKLAPRRVLEVGCGNGVNLVFLSARFPDVEFTGVELTSEGHQAALDFQRLAELPNSVKEYAPFELKDTTAFQRINFLQGDAANLSLENSSFDLVMTVGAFEQMESVRHEALAEISRVSARYLLMWEPFWDANQSVWQRMFIRHRDYFRGSIQELRDYGFKPVLAVRDILQKPFPGTCLVIAEKINDKEPPT